MINEPEHVHDAMATDAVVLEDELQPLESALQTAEERFLDREHVVGVGVGYKISDGRMTDKPSVMVLVEQKVDEALLSTSDRISKTVDNHPTDVIEVGQLFAGGGREATPLDTVDAQRLATRVRPVRPGYSVGHPQVTAGTIGAGCYDLSPFPGKPTRYYILSNNHVIANSNDSNIGDPIWQPGRFDGGTPADAIGRLTRYVPIRFDGSCNYVDAAIAEVPFDTLDRDIYWIGRPQSLVEPATVGMDVMKTGRTTHFTTGRVVAVNTTVNVNYGGGRVGRFCRQIVTTDMSAGGDSGSLVLDLEGKPVGLLFAGSATATILNPIGFVQSLLRVRLWP